MTTDHNAHETFDPPIATAPRAFAWPRLLAVGCVIVLAFAGWLYLGIVVGDMARSGPAGALGPGMSVFDWLAGRDEVAAALLQGFCRPSLGSKTAGMQAVDLALVLVMWCAMALAMMIPTAAPMILSYAEAAQAASTDGGRPASPVVVAAGYTSVWIGFAIGAAVLQEILARLALLDSGMVSASGLFSGAVFLVAGLYQFSTLKLACVTLCRQPDAFFLANWTTAAGGVFRLGARQGLFCLGCCGAMMMVMFAVGTMNVIWMAALGTIMALEKTFASTRFSRITGIAFVAIGIAFIAAAVAAHWPVARG